MRPRRPRAPVRPRREAAPDRRPALYCVFEDDDVNPPKLGRQAAERVPRGELRTYPGGHFAFLAEGVFDRLAADQIDFLRRHLGLPAGGV
jgi:pimeloyl-ACP methyl ester carboxylesterase